MDYYRNFITIDGRGKKLIVEQNNAAGIFINLCTSINIANVEVRGVGSVPYQHGITVIYKSHYIAIDSCYIHGTTGDGINISVADADSLTGNFDLYWHGDYIVSNCLIDSCADDGLQLTAARSTIKNNVFRYVDMAHGGINPQGGHPDGIQTAVEGWHMTIEGNTFINCMQAAFIEKSRGYMLVINNIMYDINSELTAGNTNRFVATNEAPSGAKGPTIFANNVFFSSNWAALYFPVSHFDSTTELIIRNNIFVNCKRWGLTDSTEMSFIRSDNIFYSSYDAYCQPGCPAYPDSGIHENPLFTNYGNHDFTLQKGSPARNAGINLSQYFTTDFNGNPRPATGAWDIGAYEYTPVMVAVRGHREFDHPVLSNDFTNPRDFNHAQRQLRAGSIKLYNLSGKVVTTAGLHRAGMYLVRPVKSNQCKKVFITK